MGSKKKTSGCLVVFLVILLLISSGAFLLVNHFYKILSDFNSSSFSGSIRPNIDIDFSKRLNIFVIGVDAPTLEEGARSDVMMLLQYDPVAKKLKMMSIPRDTKVALPEFGNVKLNAVNNQKFNPAFGTLYLIKTVENLLGIKFHAYVKTNFQGFVKIIDILGGITLNVEKDMFYHDNITDYRIALKKGPQQLYGSEALQYVRYRSDIGDFAVVDGKPVGRVGRQANFLKAIMKEASQIRNWQKLGQVLDAVKHAIETDLTPALIIKFASIIKDVSPDNIQTIAFPGTDHMIGGVSYVLPDNEKLKKTITESFLDGNNKNKPNP